jgi:toxin YoeB
MGGETVIIGFKESAFEQYREWAKKDKKTFKKLESLITDVIRDPFHGIGKPEPLRENLSGSARWAC